MTTRPAIRILGERAITTFQSATESTVRMSITYQVGPLPPDVVFVDRSDLADLVWRDAHPDAAKVPDDIQKKGDDARRDAINQHRNRSGLPGPRTL